MPRPASNTRGRGAHAGKTNRSTHPAPNAGPKPTTKTHPAPRTSVGLTPAGTPHPSGDDVRPLPPAGSRAARAAADAATLAATVTGQRHDDESAGLAGRPGRLYTPRACYVCQRAYAAVHAFYAHLCPPCAAHGFAKRGARCDMRGRVALVTGGRAKIGMYVALRLLRDGAHVTVTTRFPRDAARRFVALARAEGAEGAEAHVEATGCEAQTELGAEAEASAEVGSASHGAGTDSARGLPAAEWLGRLSIVGIDLRDPRQVLALAGMFPVLDVLVNNAAQTIRRSPNAYAPLVDGEYLPLEGLEEVPRITVLGGYVQSLLPTLDVLPAPLGLVAAGAEMEVKAEVAETGAEIGVPNEKDNFVKEAAPAAALAYAVGPTLRAIPGPPRLDVLDAAGLRPDAGASNTWSNPIGSIPPADVLEVQLCNAVAPVLLLNALRGALVAAASVPRNVGASTAPPASTSTAPPACRNAYVVNVTAREGQFAHFKTPGHAHTNVAKAGLNMLTRTVGAELARHRVLVTSVDTGWVTDERPWPAKRAAAADGFTCPLDLEDGAARVYDPVVRGEAGEALHSVLLKDYGVAPW